MLKLAAQTFKGLENCLEQELHDLGAKNIVAGRRAVTFQGDLEMLYRANVWLRTAINVVINLAEGPIRSKDDLYDLAFSIPWEEHFSVNRSFAVHGSSYSPLFNDSKFPMLLVKDAIADRFRDKFNRRPDINRERPDVKIHVRVNEQFATISLDSSGEPLFKRGYRQVTNVAPVNEVLAAGMIMLSGWKGNSHFVDPMCGAGTLLMEASMLARKIPPGFMRKHYAFKKWSNFDGQLLDKVRSFQPEAIPLGVRIMGADSSAQTIQKARRNVENLPEGHGIRFTVDRISNFEPPEGGGVAIVNPPYGERMRISEIEDLYNSIGTAFKHHFEGYDCWVISSSMEGLKQIGLAPSQKVDLYNGALACSFRKYSIYSGSKKQKAKP